MLRLAALTALVLCLVTNSRAKAQEDPFGERTPSHYVQANVTQIEVQVQLTKLKKLLEEISDHELAFARCVDLKDSEESRALIAKNQKLIESLRVESDKTRDQIFQLVKGLPEGYPLQFIRSTNQPLVPARAAQKLNSDSRKNSASTQESAAEVLGVKVEHQSAKLVAELLWGVLRTESDPSVGVEERANLIILRGEKQWLENARKLIELLDRSGSPNPKSAESR